MKIRTVTIFKKSGEVELYKLLVGPGCRSVVVEDQTEMSVKSVLSAPLSERKARRIADGNNFVSGLVRVPLNDVLNNDFEGAMDMLSEALTGSPCLMEVGYTAVGVTTDGDIIFRVSGDISECYVHDEE